MAEGGGGSSSSSSSSSSTMSATPQSTTGSEVAEPRTVEIHPWTPVNGVFVNFKGLDRVSPLSLVGECGALANVQTFRELQAALAITQALFSELELLKNVTPEIAIGENLDVDVTFVVQERKRELSAGGSVDKKGEVTADFKAAQPALFGGPLSALATVGSTGPTPKDFTLRLSTPRFLGRRLAWNLEATRGATDEVFSSSFWESATGVSMRLANLEGTQSISVEASLRDVTPTAGLARFPSLEVQTARLRTMKTSLSHMCSAGFFHPLLGMQGQARLDSELALAPGDAKFLRVEASASFSQSLPWRCSLNGQLAGGLLAPLDGQQTCLQDRFFLGGPSGATCILKGFQHRGLGPMGRCIMKPSSDTSSSSTAPAQPAAEANAGTGSDPSTIPMGMSPSTSSSSSSYPSDLRRFDCLGGDAMASASLMLSGPLDFKSLGWATEDVGARAFAFAGFGSLLLNPSKRKGLPGLFNGLKREARGSLGLGVGMPIGGMGMLEFTFAQPVWAQNHDLRQRWQLGLRLNLSG